MIVGVVDTVVVFVQFVGHKIAEYLRAIVGHIYMSEEFTIE